MQDKQSFSHGLLYSVAPENIPALHLLDEVDGHGEFDWLAYESQLAGSSRVRGILNFLKTFVTKR